MDKNVIDHVFLGKGRMNRRQDWNILIFMVLLQIFISIILGIGLVYYPVLTNVISLVSYLLYFGSLIFMIGSFIRRGHDLNFSTRFTLLWYGSCIILEILYSITQQSPIIFWILMLTMIYPLVLAFYPGTKGSNTYGEQPKDLKKINEIFRFWWTGKV